MGSKFKFDSTCGYFVSQIINPSRIGWVKQPDKCEYEKGSHLVTFVPNPRQILRRVAHQSKTHVYSKLISTQLSSIQVKDLNTIKFPNSFIYQLQIHDCVLLQAKNRSSTTPIETQQSF